MKPMSVQLCTSSVSALHNQPPSQVVACSTTHQAKVAPDWQSDWQCPDPTTHHPPTFNVQLLPPVTNHHQPIDSGSGRAAPFCHNSRDFRDRSSLRHRHQPVQMHAACQMSSFPDHVIAMLARKRTPASRHPPPSSSMPPSALRQFH
eukprot:CAMPEP_0202870718 /NCGR_PEP_ID=MMETSP1391-20130828/16556_1 /ASSEMBLY_ACC=CAM_ASM_000867 /TAXON_ID=1034604 /ORGANISM="Chlamydomonas leiostraca, Strain SAG 11-49" /LENGTH=146 /DNA_ID=CAMNT_0049551349 /DNA_START=401 /DNA_END=839 /DNA_ORIENTATION=-